MIAYNIQWDVDIEEIFDVFEKMTVEEAADFLGISERIYTNMTISERNVYIYLYFHHNLRAVEDLFELPESVNIPEGIIDKEDISDWLSDEYGFCHNGFELDTDVN